VKILLVEDNQSTCVLIEQALAARYIVEIAEDGHSALAMAEQGEYDLLLLDVDIPRLDGISVCQQLRTRGDQTPILLLTAKDGTSDRVLGLDAGADDYMVKPFHLPELLARVRALLRRPSLTTPAVVTWENLRLDCQTSEICYGEQLLRLTPKEHGILTLLLLNPQQIFSRSAMIDRLWEFGEPPTESAISSHIKAIRQKLKAAGVTHDLIETIYGFGYRLRSLDAAHTASPPSPNATNPPDVSGAAPSTAFSTDSDSQKTAASVMAALWERFKDSFTTQVDLLERAIVATQAGTLTADLRQEALQTVHKLVGALGIYGFPQGSVLAKQIETVLRSSTTLTAVEIQQLARWIEALRQELTQRNQSTVSPTPPTNQWPRVLVVDDDSDLTARLQVEAEGRSLHIKTVPHPTAAQLLLDQTAPDVILLDLTFPAHNEDGLSWLKRLKQQHPTIPVLVFTGRDSLNDRLAAARLGASQFLHKPATTAQIFQAIARVLPKPSVGTAKVLIVDDDHGVLAHLSTVLTEQGLAAVTLSEPQRFWEVFTATSPNLVLLDLEMPQVSGLELCRVVRQDAHWGDVPILVVTAHTDATLIQQAFTAGADDFITKPVLIAELMTRVLNRLERTQFRQPLKPAQ